MISTCWKALAVKARDADGLVGQIVYGDLANTTTQFTYDNRRRVKTVQTYRGPPASWSSPPVDYLPAPTFGTDPTTFQLVHQDDELSYDSVDNPVEIHDWRNPAEWPASAKPVERRMASTAQ